MMIIEHAILKVMKDKAAIIRQTGSEAKGFVPLDHFELPTARYHYGTLAALVNHPEKYMPVPENPTNYQTVILKRHEILTDVYSWEEFQKAIEILRYNKHIKEEFKGGWIYMEERMVCLTEDGLMALNTDFYIKLKKENDYKNNLKLFSITTICIAALAAIFSGSNVLISVLNKPTYPDSIQVQKVPQLIQSIQNLNKDTLKVKTVSGADQKQK